MHRHLAAFGLLAFVGLSGVSAAASAQDTGEAPAAPAAAAPAPATDLPWHAAMTLTGEAKLPAGFTHFPYADPDAPKGGLLRLGATGGFDSFNAFLPRGDIAPGSQLVYETLTTSSLDELDTSAQYGLIASEAQYPDDFAWVTYRLRPEAKWHDGQPITADDVIWSLETLRDIHPFYQYYYSHVTSAEKLGDHEVRFVFDQPGNRELPHILGQLTVLPKHWWEGTDADGRKRDIRQTTLEPPLGSGPYRVKAFTAGRSVTYERVPDAWANDLPVNVGANNFGEIRYEMYRDPFVAFEAFKADQIDWRLESSAKNWATAYDFPAVREGKVILETFPDRASGIMQAFVPNLRRPLFSDPRVREALNYAFDFETLNRTTFHDQYKRIGSFFAGTELASTGLPQGRELEILETVRDKVPPEVFTEVYENPVGGDPAKVRQNFRRAFDLLKEAGWEQMDGKLVDGRTKQPFRFELLLADPSFERVALPYKQGLSRLGIDVTVRVVDAAQYENRVRAFDYDMVVGSWGQSLSPGNEQREFWGSAAADRQGSRNLAGIKDPAVDALIERVIFATDREDLVAATRALDRVLMWNRYVVPQWHIDYDRTARWDRFGRPARLPEFSPGFPTVWWYDAEKAGKIGRAHQ